MQRGARVAARLAWPALAVALFCVATAALYGAAWREGARTRIPSRDADVEFAPVVRADHRFVVFSVARNARTLATHPSRLFDAEPCFPDDRSLAFGEPVVAMGAYGAPVSLLTDDPVLLYNVVLVGMRLAAALAMYALVVAWTGVPAAGIAAGLLYAFGRYAVADPVHPYSSDTTPTVLCLLFAERLFATGRWRDAIGLAVSVSLQLATSFYPLVASAAIGAPFAAWLVVAHRRRIPWRPLGLVAGVALAALWLVLGPYLEMRAGGVLRGHVVKGFASPSLHLPGGAAFFGWLGLGLAFAGLALPRRTWQRRAAADPRPALAVGGALCGLVAAGPYAPLDLYRLASGVVPGLDTVRIPQKIAIGVPLVLSVFAGLGLAGLVRVSAARRVAAGRAVAATGVAAAFFAALGVGGHYTTFDVRPSDDAVAFYEELARLGNAGPIYETPIPRGPDGYGWSGTSGPLLHAYFHRRRTSACYGSHPQPHRAALEQIEDALPRRRAVDALARLGFTTIVVHEPDVPPGVPSLRRRYLERARRPGSGLTEIHRDAERVAFELDGR